MIKLASVTKQYPNSVRPALIDVNAEIGAGEFVFLVGPSGSGKSTLLRLLLREERATGGQVEVAGRDVARIPDRRVPQLRRLVGCVFQDFRLLPNRTVAGNVAFALDVVGRPRHVVRSVVPEVLDLVGLAEKGDRFPDELSGGEQQRVAIARAFVGRPRVLLADEPTGNLDPTTSAEIMSLLDAINQSGTTIVMATHNAALVDQMRRRVLELADGVLVRDESGGRYDQVETDETAADETAADGNEPGDLWWGPTSEPVLVPLLPRPARPVDEPAGDVVAASPWAAPSRAGRAG